MTIIDMKKCCGCQACAQICPKGSISMKADEEGFFYPVVEEATCIHCDLCKKVCPVLHNVESKQGMPKTYAAYNQDEDVRLTSSSGGIFTLLAEYVLDQEGVVYGAAIDKSKVRHVRIVEKEGLKLLRGSKYVQSDIGQTYTQAKNDLETGKNVLFSGTPCQIEGLKAFLRKEYANLITMDIICHGVPSPMVWEKYVALREKTAGAPVARMFFRHKKYGWKAYAIFFEFTNKTAYLRRYRDDLFMKAFLYDLCLRPSCYRCSFKKANRVSDITLADFWGIQNICPEMDDDKGTSLVIVHSNRGMDVFCGLFEKMRCREVDFTDAIKYNSAMIRSALMPKHRAVFMKHIGTENFEKLVLRYAKEPFSMKRFVKQILKSIFKQISLRVSG